MSRDIDDLLTDAQLEEKYRGNTMTITPDEVREALDRLCDLARSCPQVDALNREIDALEATLTATLADRERLVRENERLAEAASVWLRLEEKNEERILIAEHALNDPAFIRVPRAVLERHAAEATHDHEAAWDEYLLRTYATPGPKPLVTERDFEEFDAWNDRDDAIQEAEEYPDPKPSCASRRTERGRRRGMSNDEALRDALFIASLSPIPDWLPAEEVVTAGAWGPTGWDLDGSAYWAIEGYESSMSAWSPKPKSATHVAIYHK